MFNIFRKTLSLSCILACLCVYSSCNSLDYEDSDSTDSYQDLIIRLSPKYAELSSFESEVDDVRVFVYNEDNELYDELAPSANELTANNYQLSVSVPQGVYRIVVWSGISDTQNYCLCNAAVSLIAPNNVTNNELKPLWHGMADNVKVAPLSKTSVEVQMEKDTNNFVIDLCATNGDVLNPDDFDTYITIADGSMDCANNVIDGQTITYSHFYCAAQQAEIPIDDDVAHAEGFEHLHFVRCDINTLRLCTDHPAYLNITNKNTGKNILTLNLNEYIIKTLHASGADAEICNQQYYDAHDFFNVTVFLTPESEKQFYVVAVSINL